MLFLRLLEGLRLSWNSHLWYLKKMGKMFLEWFLQMTSRSCLLCEYLHVEIVVSWIVGMKNKLFGFLGLGIKQNILEQQNTLSRNWWLHLLNKWGFLAYYAKGEIIVEEVRSSGSDTTVSTGAVYFHLVFCFIKDSRWSSKSCCHILTSVTKQYFPSEGLALGIHVSWWTLNEKYKPMIAYWYLMCALILMIK